MNSINSTHPSPKPPATLVTKELTFLQKLAQVYWFNPDSWLLTRLESDGSTIIIRRKNGALDAIRIGEFVYTIQFDRYSRR